MIILGIDPGIATIGFGIVEAHRSQCRVIQYGVLSTPAGLPLSHRLTMIYEDMQELIHTFHPDEMAVEELFFCRSARCRRLPWKGTAPPPKSR